MLALGFRATGVVHHHDFAALDLRADAVEGTIVGDDMATCSLKLHFPRPFPVGLNGDGLAVTCVAQVMGANSLGTLRLRCHRTGLPTGVQGGRRRMLLSKGAKRKQRSHPRTEAMLRNCAERGRGHCGHDVGLRPLTPGGPERLRAVNAPGQLPSHPTPMATPMPPILTAWCGQSRTCRSRARGSAPPEPSCPAVGHLEVSRNPSACRRQQLRVPCGLGFRWLPASMTSCPQCRPPPNRISPGRSVLM